MVVGRREGMKMKINGRGKKCQQQMKGGTCHQDIVRMIREEYKSFVVNVETAAEAAREEAKANYENQTKRVDSMFGALKKSLEQQRDRLIRMVISNKDKQQDNMVNESAGGDSYNGAEGSDGRYSNVDVQMEEEDVRGMEENGAAENRERGHEAGGGNEHGPGNEDDEGEHIGERGAPEMCERNQGTMHSAPENVECEKQIGGEDFGGMGGMGTASCNAEDVPGMYSTPSKEDGAEINDMPMFDRSPPGSGRSSCGLFLNTPVIIKKLSKKKRIVDMEETELAGGAKEKDIEHQEGSGNIGLKRKKYKTMGKKRKGKEEEGGQGKEMGEKKSKKKKKDGSNVREKRREKISGSGSGEGPEAPLKGEKITPCRREVDSVVLPPSPFELNLCRPTKFNLENVEKYEKIMVMRGSEIHRMWIVSELPTELKISGADLQCQFRVGEEIKENVFCGMVRLMQNKEIKLYQNCKINKWRFFMNPGFTRYAPNIEEFVSSGDIREMLLGHHSGALIEHCRMIMIPSRGRGDWCLYVWDLKLKKIHVLDPVHTYIDVDELWNLHEGFIEPIREKLEACKEALFPGWNVDFYEFPDQYWVVEHDGASSAFYVLHYMNWFDGENMLSLMNKGVAEKMRKHMLFELITMKGNIGVVPGELLETIDIS